MRTTTRRGFLAGALATGVAPAAVSHAAEPAPAPGGPLQAKQEVVRRGRAIAVAADGSRVVVAHDQRRTVAVVTPGREGERLVDVGGQPLAVAVSAVAPLAAVTTASWDGPGLALVDLEAAAPVRRIDVGPAPYDVAFAGDRLVVSGGGQAGTVHVVDTGGAVVAQRAIGTLPRGVAPDPAGGTAWIALAGVDRVVRVDLSTGRVRQSMRTPSLPERVAISADGSRLLVSHTGLGAEHVSEIDIGSGRATPRRAGRLPSAVAWTGAGDRLVALGGAGEVVVLGPAGERARHAVGGAPRGLAVAGRRAWTVDALTGALHEVAV